MSGTRKTTDKALHVTGGAWVRFSKYEIRDGLIRPADGATLEIYDPWDDYRRDRQDDGPVPYESLLELISSLTLSVRPGVGGFTLTRGSEAQVLEWCSRHGLLGVLLAQVERVVLPPRWIGGMPAGLSGVGPSYPFPQQVRYVRTNIGWEMRTFTDMGGMDRLMHGTPREGRPTVPEGAIGTVMPEEWLRFFPKLEKPRVWLRDLLRGELIEEDLDQTWARYFPGVSAVDFPKPALAEVDDEQALRSFWERYAEPVDDFVRAASALRDALDGLREARPLGEMTPQQLQSLSRGIPILHALIFPVRAAVGVLEDGSMREQWIAPSLLSSLAKMVHQDVTGGRRPLACTECGRTFVTSAYQAKYCSPRCRNTAQKREYRRKKLDEKRTVPAITIKASSQTAPTRGKRAKVSTKADQRLRPRTEIQKPRAPKR